MHSIQHQINTIQPDQMGPHQPREQMGPPRPESQNLPALIAALMQRTGVLDEATARYTDVLDDRSRHEEGNRRTRGLGIPIRGLINHFTKDRREEEYEAARQSVMDAQSGVTNTETKIAAKQAEELQQLYDQLNRTQQPGSSEADIQGMLQKALLSQSRAEDYRTRPVYAGAAGVGGQVMGRVLQRREEEDALSQLKQAYGAQGGLDYYRQEQAQIQQQIAALQERQAERKKYDYRTGVEHRNAMELKRTGNQKPNEYEQRQNYGRQMGLQGNELQSFVLTGKYGEAKPEVDFDDAAKLRTEFNKQTQGFASLTDSYGRIQASAQNPDAAGDLALIFNYMKMLDPGSTVREGEFATAQNSASIPNRIWAAYNRVLSGERMAEGQRREFVGRADKLYQRASQTYQGRRSEYHDLARRMNFDPEQIYIERQVLESQPMALTDPTPGMQAQEGMVIHNQATGETLIFRNGQWGAQ